MSKAALAYDRALRRSDIISTVIAFDRSTDSVRTVDQDGHMHVTITNISKATVNPYLGSEIPNHEALGLDPHKVYQLFRDPEELEKGAKTFDGKPLLFIHTPASADDHPFEETVGSVGESGVFEAPYLKNSLHIWPSSAIAGIESDEQREISCSYRYRADMTPGTHNGLHFDGVMRDIVGNHVALVETGRAGPDVLVNDSRMETRKMITAPALKSRKAIIVHGALAAYLMPKLAADARLDLGPVLSGVNRKNWKTRKSSVIAALKKATKNSLAADADLEDVVAMLDSLDDVEAGANDEEDNTEKKKEETADDDDDPAMDAEAITKYCADNGMSSDAIEGLKAMMGKDADPDDKDDKKDKGAMDKAAMDSAISAAVKNALKGTVTKTELSAMAEARELVRPHVGEVSFALDSAEAILKVALDHAEMDLDGVHPSAYRALVKTLVAPGDEPVKAAKVGLAVDSATSVQLKTLFPNFRRVRAA